MGTNSQDFFSKYTWERFSARRNLEFLLAGDEHFHNHKEIVTQAISSWVVSGKPSIRKNAIMLSMVETIGEAERASVKGKPEHNILGDFMARVSQLKPDFFSRAYYPIGGIKTLTKMDSIGQHRRNLKKSSHDLHFFIELMRIFHFWHSDLNDLSLYAKPSLSNACPLIGNVKQWPGERGPTTRLRIEINRYMRRASLIYSASAIKIYGRITLLEAMRHHVLSFEVLEQYLQTWLSYAKFVTDDILKNVATAEKLEDNHSYLPQKDNAKTLPQQVSPVAFALDPPFTSEAIEKVRGGFPYRPAGRKKKSA